MSDDILDEARRVVGNHNVLTGADAAPFLVDWRNKYPGTALAVVRPGSTQEVADLMKWCATHDLIVVMQGGNTGLSGGTYSDDDTRCVLLNLSRMNAVEAVDASGWTMTVQAGATIEALQNAASAAGRLFGPDWGARGTATIGGAIATDAGGNNVVAYGNMRDQVLGLEVVLADGRVWDGMRALRKDSSGYDLKQLFIGAEGTLGVITRAVVKLHPAPAYAQTAMAALSDLDHLMDVFGVFREIAPDAVVAFELVPEIGILRVCELFDLQHPMTTNADFYVLVKLAAAQAVDDQLHTALSTATDHGWITDAVVAVTADQESQLWRIREELPPAVLYPLHAEGMKMDTAVPVAEMGSFHDAVRDIAHELVPDAVVYGFGHVGDGNLHMNVLPATDGQLDDFRAAKPELVRRIDELVFSLNGTLSAEHGVGRELRSRVAAQKPAIEWELMRGLKAALDPDGRLNPGVLLPDPPDESALRC